MQANIESQFPLSEEHGNCNVPELLTIVSCVMKKESTAEPDIVVEVAPCVCSVRIYHSTGFLEELCFLTQNPSC